VEVATGLSTGNVCSHILHGTGLVLQATTSLRTGRYKMGTLGQIVAVTVIAVLSIAMWVIQVAVFVIALVFVLSILGVV
jgi:hypothetical protein